MFCLLVNPEAAFSHFESYAKGLGIQMCDVCFTFLFVKESRSVTLSLYIGEIVKVLIHFGRGMPVLFLYTVPTAAARVRAALSMESKQGPYYDPTSPGIVNTTCQDRHL